VADRKIGVDGLHKVSKSECICFRAKQPVQFLLREKVEETKFSREEELLRLII